MPKNITIKSNPATPQVARSRRRDDKHLVSNGIAWSCLALLLTASSVAFAEPEHTSATIDDLSTYTIIPNVKASGSFIRIFGSTNAATNIEIRSFGNKTGREYTTKPLQIRAPANASPHQYLAALDDAAALAGAGKLSPDGEDTAVTLYVRNTDPAVTGLYQHITYNQITQTLDNASVCSYNSRTPDLSILNRMALNVHTSLLPSHASFLSVTNPDSVPRVVSLVSYNAVTGVDVGQLPNFTVPANSTVRFPATDLETQGKPRAENSDYQVDVVLFQGAGDTAVDSKGLPKEITAVLSHTIINVATGVESNLTQICPIAPPPVPEKTPTGPVDPSPDPINCPLARVGANSKAIIQEILYNYTAACPADRDWPADKSTPGYLSPDSGANGRIATPTDVDWWKVDLVAGGRYDLKFLPENADLSNRRMALRDPNGVPIPGALLVAHQNKFLSDYGFLYQATVTGTYYIEVSAATDGAVPNAEGNPGTTGRYQLQVVAR
ncbi:MAG: hypothetical protein K2P94_08430 [Rhodospirillaceae bacterium]|nr:hypothetical protein [Rhodospirillaceae bacterium]